MTMVVAWPDRSSRERSAWQRLQRRIAVSLRLWQRRRTRRRFVNAVLATTSDPAALADLGIGPAGPSHIQRWIAAMLRHQH
jgi:hypothetical protein